TENVGQTAFNAADQIRLSTDRAMRGLDSLRAGYTAQDVAEVMNLNVINFAPGSSQIPRESTAFLDKAAAALKNAQGGAAVEVAGHTDNTGSAATNMQLAQQRAEAVRSYLVQQGVGAASLTARGYGDTRPVASNDSEEGRFRNRRIEFAVR